jgi:hypothetical protein
MSHKYAGRTVADILRDKKLSVRKAPLPPGSPNWPDIEPLSWEEIESRAKNNEPGFKAIRKLLTDRRFDR